MTLDTLRYDSFAGAGDRDSDMPRLRAWASNATIFDGFYSASASTQPSHASMLTGQDPWDHGLSGNGQRLSEVPRTIAERFKEAGFATSAVVASFPVSAHFGFDRGFERFDDSFELGSIGGEWLEGAADEASGTAAEEGHLYSLADSVVDHAIAQISAGANRRQFFWFHFFDPHSPYGDSRNGPRQSPLRILAQASRGEDTTAAVAEARRLYDLDVRYLDTALARLLERLEADSPRIETHVVLAADHGESFGEEGSLAHGRRLIPSQIHVPLLIRSPTIEPGVRHDIAGSVDVAATLLGFAGLGDGAGSGSGRDLAQLAFDGATASGMRRTYEKPYEERRLDGSVHLIEGLLFYLVDENGTLHRGNGQGLLEPQLPKAQLRGEEAEKLRLLFEGFEERLAASRTLGVVDPSTEERLRALGYVR